MPAPDLSSFKVAADEVSSATKFNNLVQAIQDEFSDIDPDQIPGYPNSVAAFLRGDGAWAGAFSTYTPAWTASGTAPAIGDGTLTGRYLQIGKMVIVQIALTAGSTTTFGTGAWFFSLPVADAGASVSAHGNGFANDSGANFYANLVRLEPGNQKVSVLTMASPGAFYSNTAPFAWGNGDKLELSLVYEAA